MFFNIIVTNGCNLSCKYCYASGNKGSCIFNKDLVEDLCTFIISKYKSSKEEIIINFLGGEPLLAFSTIQEIIEKLEMNGCGDCTYFITTNGTLLNSNICNYLVEKNFSVSISIDGKKEIHDYNRINKKGQGSYDDVIKGYNLLKTSGCKKIRIRGTYNSKTVFSLKENIEHLMCIEPQNSIVFAADIFDKGWNTESLNEIKKVYDFIKKEKLDNVIILEEKADKCTLCGGGFSSFYINYNGDIYPCNYVVGEKLFKIGHITSGIDKNILSHIQKIYKERIKLCNGCKNEYLCKTFKCKFLNYKIKGDLYKPAEILCELERLIS